MPKNSIKVAVLGAGHGGKAMAAHLALMGFETNLYNRYYYEPEYLVDLDDIRKKGGIKLVGAIKGTGYLHIVSNRIDTVVKDVDVIMIVVPANAHRFIATKCAPYLHDNQIVILNPGRTFGAIEFLNTLRRCGCKSNIKIAETQTLLYTTRAISPTRVKIYGVKDRVPFAAYPASDTDKIYQTISDIFPQFVPATNVLETSLNNIGAIMHPAITLFNLGNIEHHKKFDFYIEGATPGVCKVIEQLDEERCEIAKVFGVRCTKVKDWISVTYGVNARTLYESIQKNKAYKGLKAPITLKHRYIYEDVPTGLVPLESFGNAVGKDTSFIKTIIDLACMVTGIDFWTHGRTVERLGIAGLSVNEIKKKICE